MARTLELGRAVLSSTTTQLWLRTLITLSPQQECIDIQQQTQTALIELLVSGGVWICRGNGMHLKLDITTEGEPLDTAMRNKLAQSIIKAPVWEQLLLSASLPDRQEQGDLENKNILLVHIRHAHTANSPEKQNHRIGIDVPYADVKPPDGVPTLALDSIRFVMEVFRSKPPSRNKKRKRPDETASIMRVKTFDAQPLPTFEAKLVDEPGMVETAGSLSASMAESNSKVLNNNALSDDKASMDMLDVEKLVDHAMRLSVNNVSPKSVAGITIVANSISACLADIAPNIWRLEYLPGFSRRSHFLSTIAQSIARTACSKARSMSLKDKLDRLTGESAGSTFLSKAPGNRLSKTDATHAHLWNYLQKSLANKAAPGLLKSFCSSGAQAGLTVQSNPMASSPSHTSQWLKSLSSGLGSSSHKQNRRHRSSEGIMSNDNEASTILNDESRPQIGNSFGDYGKGVDNPSSDDLLFCPMSTRKNASADHINQSRPSDFGSKHSSHFGSSEKLSSISDEHVEERLGTHFLRHSYNPLLEGTSKHKFAKDGSQLLRPHIEDFHSHDLDFDFDFDVVPMV